MRTACKCVLISFLLSIIAGCSSIRVVQEGRTGGTIALQGPHEGARAKAEEHMRAQCPHGWQIIEEGEALATDNVTREWRITYACNGGDSRFPPTKTKTVAF